MAVKVGINGFGRIGRMVFQAREAELMAGSLQAAPAGTVGFRCMSREAGDSRRQAAVVADLASL